MVCKTPEYAQLLLSTSDISKLTGFAPSTVRSWIHAPVNPFPQPVRRYGRHFRWSKAEVLDWMESRGIKPLVPVDDIGEPMIIAPEGDRLLDTQAVASKLNIQRSWLHESLRGGWLPKPDISPGAPLPNYWLESSIDRWLANSAAVN